jgi:2-polyprenyl-6-methoxyphenol hydroxylase-like FAD-dependent oxidoreductase
MAWKVSSGRPDRGGMTSPDRAVVIGASMAGLLAARVLSDHFARVTVVDRDALPAEPVARRGVPQGRHLHGVLALGLQIFEELFPGLTRELVSQGATQCDMQSDFHWYFGGRLLNPAPSGVIGLGVSRGRLELAIRDRVAARPGVEIIDNCEALGLVTDSGGQRVTGASILPRADGAASSVLDAALVVDASGRASRAPRWLTALGFDAPEEDVVPIDVTYVTWTFRRGPEFLGGRAATMAPAYPGSPQAAILAAIENDTALLSTASILGHEPPMDDAGLADFSRSLASDDYSQFVETATPIGEPVKMRFPRSQRRRYEQLTRFPEGFLVLGDALCSFNPVYGQGMTVAAAEARALGWLLAEGADQVGPRFFAAAAPVVDTPWTLASGSDLRFLPEADQPPGAAAMNAFIDRLQAVAEHDPVVATAFIRVINLLDPPERLSEPEIAGRVLAPSGT